MSNEPNQPQSPPPAQPWWAGQQPDQQGQPQQGPQYQQGPPTTPPPPPRPSKPWWQRPRTWVLGGIGFVVLVGILGSLGGDPTTPTTVTATTDAQPQPEATPQATPAATPAAKAPAPKPKPKPELGIGDPAKDGNFTFTVTSVEKGPKRIGSEYLGQTAQGKFVLVHVTVENTGDEAGLFTSSGQYGFDKAGRKFEPDGEAAIYLEDSKTFLEDINPGNSVKGTLVFDVPKDVTLTRLELHDSLFSGGVTVSLQ